MTHTPDSQMLDLPVHTLIGPENKRGGLLLVGINHGWSKEDQRRELAGEANLSAIKSFFSDSQVNNTDFRNRLVAWFKMWGFELDQDQATAGGFEKSIVQTNWLQSCSNNLKGTNIFNEAIHDADSFLETCAALKPEVVFLFSKQLMLALTDRTLAPKVEAIFGARVGAIDWRKKDVSNRRKFLFGFQKYEGAMVVSLPHVTGAKGLANDYVAAFKPDISDVINPWWLHHQERLR